LGFRQWHDVCSLFGAIANGPRRTAIGAFVMLLPLAAVSSALDTLQSLTSSKSASAQGTGLSRSAANPFELLGSGTKPGSAPRSSSFGGSRISPETMSALIAAQTQAGSTVTSSSSRSGALQHLFSQVDADGDGKLSKSEFENALGAGGTNLAMADDVFNKLDKNGDGVSLDELTSALRGSPGHHGKYDHHAHADRGISDPAITPVNAQLTTLPPGLVDQLYRAASVSG